MNGWYIALSSLFELTAIALLVFAYIHEDRVKAWETRVFRKCKKSLRNLLRKNKRIVMWANGEKELNKNYVWSK